MQMNQRIRIVVGADLSRAASISSIKKDVINRSLQKTYPNEFVKLHNQFLQKKGYTHDHISRSTKNRHLGY